MKATEFPIEEIIKAAHCSNSFTCYQFRGEKHRLFLEIPLLSITELNEIMGIVKYWYFSISADNGNIVFCFYI